MQYHARDAATVDAKPAFHRVSRDDLHLLHLLVTCSIARLEKSVAKEADACGREA